MKPPCRQSVIRCLAVLASLTAVAPAVFAQTSPPFEVIQNSRVYPAAAAFGQQELDQMLAPIALYPDSLLTQILMASTYPLEAVHAARWSRANPGISGDQAVRAVQQQNWDPSVKSLVAFPEILALMEGSLNWTERLGDAFLSQQPQIWDTVQTLRQRADAAGNLQSNEQLRVKQDGPNYIIESARPEVVYVPYYDPLTVYGDWWWPGYAPMRWSTWDGYYSQPFYSRGFYWGRGVWVGYGFFFGCIDWRLGHANVINDNSFYYRNVNRRPGAGNGWLHDPDHRRGVAYRNPVLDRQFSRTPGSPDSHGDYRGRYSNTPAAPGAGNGVTRGNQGDRGDRRQQRPPQSPGLSGAPHQQFPPGQGGTRQVLAQGAVPPTLTARGNFPRARGEQPPEAFERVGRSDDARNASARGQANSPRPPVTMPQRPTVAPQTSRPVQPLPQMQPSVHESAPRRVQPAPQQREQRQQPEQRQGPGPGNAPRERNRA